MLIFLIFQSLLWEEILWQQERNTVRPSCHWQVRSILRFALRLTLRFEHLKCKHDILKKNPGKIIKERCFLFCSKKLGFMGPFVRVETRGREVAMHAEWKICNRVLRNSVGKSVTLERGCLNVKPLHSVAHWQHTCFRFQDTAVQIQVGEKKFPLLF